MHHRPLLPLLLATLACALAVPAHAEENKRLYDVEIVIIENTDTSAGERERWQARVTVPEVEGAIAFEPRSELAKMARRDRLAETPEGFEPLPPEQLKLGGAIEKLQESEQFRVLRHIAWRQPAYDREQSMPVRAYYGEPITVRVPITDFEELYAMEQLAAEQLAADEEAEAGEADGETAGSGEDADAAAADDDTEATDTAETRTGERDEFAAGTVDDAGSARTFGAGPMFQSRVRPLLRPVEIHPLDGTVRVVVSRYLHVYTNLYYTTPVQWTVLPGMGGQQRSDEAEGEQAENGDEGAMEPVYNAPTGGAGLPSVALGPDGHAMLSYPFVQHRRMRSGELHYLDHPVLGMLIRVDRAPEPEEETEEGEEATQS